MAPPQNPFYTLSGHVTYSDNDNPVVGVVVSVFMTELYQGDFMDSTGAITDNNGFYEIHDLYRGRFDIMVVSDLDTLFVAEVGIIKYEDKVYDILVIPPDTTGTE